MTTKHTCNNGKNPVFGRKTPGCPRCDELISGAPAVSWSPRLVKSQEAQQIKAITNHSCKSAGCGIVCTFGEW